ncbi:MAG: FtsK/SpoIIIE domain-containing protein [Isosphaeraceae bacterium]
MSSVEGPVSHATENTPRKPEPALISRERNALRNLLRLVAERATREKEIEKARSARTMAADRDLEQARQALSARVEALSTSARQADETARRLIVDTAVSGEAHAKEEFARASRRIAAEFDGAREKVKNQLARDKSDAALAFEAGEREAALTFARSIRPVEDSRKILEAMRQRLNVLFEAYRKFGLEEPAESAASVSLPSRNDVPVEKLYDILARAEPPLVLLEGLIIPKALKGYRFLWIFVLVFLLLCGPLLWISQGEAVSVVGALVGAAAVGWVLRSWLYTLCRTQVSRLLDPVRRSLNEAESWIALCREAAEENLKSQKARVSESREENLRRARDRKEKTLAAAETMRDERLRDINEVYAARMSELRTNQQVGLRGAIESYQRRKAEIETLREAGVQKLDHQYHLLKENIQTRHSRAWTAMATTWRDGFSEVLATLNEVRRELDQTQPVWESAAWDDPKPASQVPSVLRFGEVLVNLEQLDGGVSTDARLMEGITTDLSFPALFAFPDQANLHIVFSREGRNVAIELLQATMFRLLSSMPAGRIRFTIIDPVGIGRNFGAFMHLTDFDEALVSGQIWTEPRQIEERLADLSAHMEKVTQKYLRNEYATIAEYNAVAGEVAEAYRVLVIADFPAAFDEKSVARLASILAGGASCGILTLIAVDRDRAMPEGVTLDELGEHGTRLSWESGHFDWREEEFSRFPLVVDRPPSTTAATRLIQRLGSQARDAQRIEVSFEFIAPSVEAWWGQDSRGGIEVALGKAGATKRQNLTLGKGTSQHVLIAGRTGSGKSTLLHALITNLALNYSPDEVDLYLIDFKKGVEFKVYAAEKLPHASVVAIESEREFGISVLQRLDAMMRERGDLFRKKGVQDIQGYRNAEGSTPLPRLILIVDEFQEFFVVDDKLAQEAALFLDRLVRQGRAFGVHVILGSQTLGGAYALARSTLGQMAVRIALQCGEADASLILNEQNTAARLLGRPGEAVYNDSNGTTEGNNFFQVVWLSDDRRESYLKQLRDLADARKPALARHPIIFEGDAAAEIARNPLLTSRLEQTSWPASPRTASAWLGEPVAIKDPTAAQFRRQAGSHLLMIGQNDEAALGILASALVSLASQYPPPDSEAVRAGARFVILDGTPEDHPRAYFLARVAERLPHPVEAGGWNDAPRSLETLAEEVVRRQQSNCDGPEVFLFLEDLPRFRDLRKRPDDFGFSRRDDETALPADHFQTILRDGPGVGVHVLAWCDSLNNLNRIFDHQMLREFEMRVLFQMSASDSGHLLDTPQAGTLGPNRALFSSEEQNRIEKFRPYGIPSDDWLALIGTQFMRKTQGKADS